MHILLQNGETTSMRYPWDFLRMHLSMKRSQRCKRSSQMWTKWIWQTENIWSRYAFVIPNLTKTETYASCFRVCLAFCRSLIYWQEEILQSESLSRASASAKVLFLELRAKDFKTIHGWTFTSTLQFMYKK